MKLIYRLILQMSVALLVLTTVWATVFYFIIIGEVNDETDDLLEDYTEQIIARALAGESLPSQDNGTNNTYLLAEVSAEYATRREAVQYFEEMVYVEAKGETEPARILKTIFCDSNNRYYELTVAIPTIEKKDLQEAILIWLIILYIVQLVVLVALIAWLMYRSFKPLYALLKWLDSFSINKKPEPLKNNTKITEFRKLTDAVLRSSKRNIEMYEQQNLFIGHASHEMQTPLAICKNRLELLANDPEITENQLEEILKTKQTLDYLVKLNKTLLLLTKIENKQFFNQQKLVVNSLFKQLIDDYCEVYEHQNISLSFVEDAVLAVSMNDTLVSVLFSNLLKNAFVHNHKNGHITIRITSKGVVLSNSSEMGELDSTKIFTRFYQGTKKEGSTGLGLALVASICKLYGINIYYFYKDKEHYFSLAIPGSNL